MKKKYIIEIEQIQRLDIYHKKTVYKLYSIEKKTHGRKKINFYSRNIYKKIIT